MNRYKSAVVWADTPDHRSGVVYPYKLLASECDRLLEDILHRRFIGTLGPVASSLTVIQLAHASHLVTDLWMRGQVMWAEIEPINTPCGRFLQNLIDNKSPIRLAPVGFGTLQHQLNGNLLTSVPGSDYRFMQIEVLAGSTPKLAGQRFRSIDDEWEITAPYG